MSRIEIVNVTKRYGTKVAVDDLSIEVAPGELFAFIGANGAGKTTTIKMMTGLLRPSEGVIRIGGADTVTNPVDAKRHVGYVPDQPYVYEKLSAREFLRFVGRLHGMADDRIAERTREFVDFFEMADYVDDLAEGYSHGMRQRVVLSAALLHEPDVLLIDEPMVGLDPVAANQVKLVLKQRTEQGAAVFMSTHTLSLVEDLADRVGIIRAGRLVACGTLPEVLRRCGGKQRLEEAFLEVLADGPNAAAD